MKKQKLVILARRAMRETAFGSTERDDAIANICHQNMILDATLRAVCRGTQRADYWLR